MFAAVEMASLKTAGPSPCGGWSSAGVIGPLSHFELGYNLDKSGNVALAFSYKKGRNEESAKLTDLFKISLNVKTCSALFGFSGKTCAGDESDDAP